jgi:hypothetical protein
MNKLVKPVRLALQWAGASKMASFNLLVAAEY